MFGLRLANDGVSLELSSPLTMVYRLHTKCRLTTAPPASSAATSPRPARSRLPPSGAPSLASVQSVSPAPRCTSPGSAAAPVAVASSASPGSIPAPRSDAPAPAAPPPDIASTAASPADSSPPSAPPLPPTSSRPRLPPQAPPLASTLVRSSLSSSTRPPLEACSLRDISNEHERGHYHRGTTRVF